MTTINVEEFKKHLVESERQLVKDQYISEGTVPAETFMSEEQIQEVIDEIEIEQFEEEVEFEGEINLEEVFICEDTGVETHLDFVPMVEGNWMDIEMEILEDYLDEESLEKIMETLYADDYEILSEAGSNKGAKVVFRRAKGKISKMKKCGKGFRLKGNRCIPQTGGQKAANRMKGIRLKRAKRAMGMGKKKRAALKAKITKKRIKTRARNYSGTLN